MLATKKSREPGGVSYILCNFIENVLSGDFSPRRFPFFILLFSWFLVVLNQLFVLLAL